MSSTVCVHAHVRVEGDVWSQNGFLRVWYLSQNVNVGS